MEHSLFSASAADRWMPCPGSIALDPGGERSSSVHAAEGTAAHQVLTWALQQSVPASHFIGTQLEVDGYEFTVDEEMAGHVQTCIDYVRDSAQGGVVVVDSRVNYSRHLGVPSIDGFGTLDVMIMRGDEIHVIDFKYGRGVEVDVEDNRQLKLYALGALDEYGQMMGIARVRIAISQPRVNAKPAERTLTVEELEAWGLGEARTAATAVRNAISLLRLGSDVHWQSTYLRPGEKQCRFCPAKATCPAIRDDVLGAVFGSPPATVEEFSQVNVPSKDHIEPADVNWLASVMAKADLIEAWLKAVRAEVERRLLAGNPVPGYKLVQGRQGDRAWTDREAAEKLLREVFRLKVEDAYDMKLISPTSAEKLAKAGTIGPRQWPKAQALITRAAGKPSVAPASDPRDALDMRPAAEDFQPVVETDDML